VPVALPMCVSLRESERGEGAGASLRTAKVDGATGSPAGERGVRLLGGRLRQGRRTRLLLDLELPGPVVLRLAEGLGLGRGAHPHLAALHLAALHRQL
jgi:hypothetical protein